MRIDMPPSLADISVAQILDVLRAIVSAIEDHYADQLFRYYDPPDERQYPLWDDAHDDLDDCGNLDDIPY